MAIFFKYKNFFNRFFYIFSRGSARRYYLDLVLGLMGDRFFGSIIDIGGKKSGSRGFFCLNNYSVDCVFLNIDPTTKPDYLCNAELTVLREGIFDIFLLLEVLEHVIRPEAVIDEAFRLLKPGGFGFISIPFMYPVHADPDDHIRWTAHKIDKELNRAGFRVESISPMGGPFSVIHDVMWTLSWRAESKILRFFSGVLIATLKPILLTLDRVNVKSSHFITTGWFIVVQKST